MRYVIPITLALVWRLVMKDWIAVLDSIQSFKLKIMLYVISVAFSMGLAVWGLWVITEILGMMST